MARSIPVPGFGEVPIVAVGTIDDGFGLSGFGSDDEEPIFLSPIQRRLRGRGGILDYGLGPLGMLNSMTFGGMGTGLGMRGVRTVGGSVNSTASASTGINNRQVGNVNHVGSAFGTGGSAGAAQQQHQPSPGSNRFAGDAHSASPGWFGTVGSTGASQQQRQPSIGLMDIRNSIANLARRTGSSFVNSPVADRRDGPLWEVAAPGESRGSLPAETGSRGPDGGVGGTGLGNDEDEGEDEDQDEDGGDSFEDELEEDEEDEYTEYFDEDDMYDEDVYDEDVYDTDPYESDGTEEDAAEPLLGRASTGRHGEAREDGFMSTEEAPAAAASASPAPGPASGASSRRSSQTFHGARDGVEESLLLPPCRPAEDVVIAPSGSEVDGTPRPANDVTQFNTSPAPRNMSPDAGSSSGDTTAVDRLGAQEQTDSGAANASTAGVTSAAPGTGRRRGRSLTFAWAAARFALGALFAPLRLFLFVAGLSSGAVAAVTRPQQRLQTPRRMRVTVSSGGRVPGAQMDETVAGAGAGPISLLPTGSGPSGSQQQQLATRQSIEAAGHAHVDEVSPEAGMAPDETEADADASSGGSGGEQHAAPATPPTSAAPSSAAETMPAVPQQGASQPPQRHRIERHAWPALRVSSNRNHLRVRGIHPVVVRPHRGGGRRVLGADLAAAGAAAPTRRVIVGGRTGNIEVEPAPTVAGAAPESVEGTQGLAGSAEPVLPAPAEELAGMAVHGEGPVYSAGAQQAPAIVRAVAASAGGTDEEDLSTAVLRAGGLPVDAALRTLQAQDASSPSETDIVIPGDSYDQRHTSPASAAAGASHPLRSPDAAGSAPVGFFSANSQDVAGRRRRLAWQDSEISADVSDEGHRGCAPSALQLVHTMCDPGVEADEEPSESGSECEVGTFRSCGRQLADADMEQLLSFAAFRSPGPGDIREAAAAARVRRAHVAAAWPRGSTGVADAAGGPGAGAWARRVAAWSPHTGLPRPFGTPRALLRAPTPQRCTEQTLQEAPGTTAATRLLDSAPRWTTVDGTAPGAPAPRNTSAGGRPLLLHGSRHGYTEASERLQRLLLRRAASLENVRLSMQPMRVAELGATPAYTHPAAPRVAPRTAGGAASAAWTRAPSAAYFEPWLLRLRDTELGVETLNMLAAQLPSGAETGGHGDSAAGSSGPSARPLRPWAAPAAAGVAATTGSQASPGSGMWDGTDSEEERQRRMRPSVVAEGDLPAIDATSLRPALQSDQDGEGGASGRHSGGGVRSRLGPDASRSARSRLRQLGGTGLFGDRRRPQRRSLQPEEWEDRGDADADTNDSLDGSGGLWRYYYSDGNTDHRALVDQTRPRAGASLVDLFFPQLDLRSSDGGGEGGAMLGGAGRASSRGSWDAWSWLVNPLPPASLRPALRVAWADPSTFRASPRRGAATATATTGRDPPRQDEMPEPRSGIDVSHNRGSRRGSSRSDICDMDSEWSPGPSRPMAHHAAPSGIRNPLTGWRSASASGPSAATAPPRDTPAPDAAMPDSRFTAPGGFELPPRGLPSVESDTSADLSMDDAAELEALAARLSRLVDAVVGAREDTAAQDVEARIGLPTAASPRPEPGRPSAQRPAEDSGRGAGLASVEERPLSAPREQPDEAESGTVFAHASDLDALSQGPPVLETDTCSETDGPLPAWLTSPSLRRRVYPPAVRAPPSSTRPGDGAAPASAATSRAAAEAQGSTNAESRAGLQGPLAGSDDNSVGGGVGGGDDVGGSSSELWAILDELRLTQEALRALDPFPASSVANYVEDAGGSPGRGDNSQPASMWDDDMPPPLTDDEDEDEDELTSATDFFHDDFESSDGEEKQNGDSAAPGVNAEDASNDEDVPPPLLAVDDEMDSSDDLPPPLIDVDDSADSFTSGGSLSDSGGEDEDEGTEDDDEGDRAGRYLYGSECDDHLLGLYDSSTDEAEVRDPAPPPCTDSGRPQPRRPTLVSSSVSYDGTDSDVELPELLSSGSERFTAQGRVRTAVGWRCFRHAATATSSATSAPPPTGIAPTAAASSRVVPLPPLQPSRGPWPRTSGIPPFPSAAAAPAQLPPRQPSSRASSLLSPPSEHAAARGADSAPSRAHDGLAGGSGNIYRRMARAREPWVSPFRPDEHEEDAESSVSSDSVPPLVSFGPHISVMFRSNRPRYDSPPPLVDSTDSESEDFELNERRRHATNSAADTAHLTSLRGRFAEGQATEQRAQRRQEPPAATRGSAATTAAAGVRQAVGVGAGAHGRGASLQGSPRSDQTWGATVEAMLRALLHGTAVNTANDTGGSGTSAGGAAEESASAAAGVRTRGSLLRPRSTAAGSILGGSIGGGGSGGGGGGGSQIVASLVRIPADMLSNVPPGSVLRITLPAENLSSGGTGGGGGSSGGGGARSAGLAAPPGMAAGGGGGGETEGSGSRSGMPGVLRVQLGALSPFPTSWRSYLPPEDASGRHPNDQAGLPGTYEEADIPAWAARFAPPRQPHGEAPGFASQRPAAPIAPTGSRVADDGATIADVLDPDVLSAWDEAVGVLGAREEAGGTGDVHARGATNAISAGQQTGSPAIWHDLWDDFSSFASVEADEDEDESGDTVKEEGEEEEPGSEDEASGGDNDHASDSGSVPDSLPDLVPLWSEAGGVAGAQVAPTAPAEVTEDWSGSEGDLSDSDSTPDSLPDLVALLPETPEAAHSQIAAAVPPPPPAETVARAAVARTAIRTTASDTDDDMPQLVVDEGLPETSATAVNDGAGSPSVNLGSDDGAVADHSPHLEHAAAHIPQVQQEATPDREPATTTFGDPDSSDDYTSVPPPLAESDDEGSDADVPPLLRGLIHLPVPAPTQQQHQQQQPTDPFASLREHQSAGPILEDVATAAPSLAHLRFDMAVAGTDTRSVRGSSAPARVPLPPMPAAAAAAPPPADAGASAAPGTGGAPGRPTTSRFVPMADDLGAASQNAPSGAAARPHATQGASNAAGTGGTEAPSPHAPARRNAVTYPRSVLLEMLEALRAPETAPELLPVLASSRAAAAAAAAARPAAAAAAFRPAATGLPQRTARTSSHVAAAAALLSDSAFVDRLLAELPGVSSPPACCVVETMRMLSAGM